MLTERDPAAFDAVEARVLDLVAETSGWSRAELATASPALDAPLDSLTAIAVITRIEAAFGIELTGDDAVTRLAARDFAGLSRLVLGAIAEQRANPAEMTGNERC